MTSYPTFAQAVRESCYGWDRVDSYYDEDSKSFVTRLLVSQQTVEEAVFRHSAIRLPGLEDVAERAAKTRSRKGLRRYGRKHGNR